MDASDYAVCATTAFNVLFFVLQMLFLLASLFLGCWLRGKYAEEQQSELYSSEQRTIFPFHLNILAYFVGAQIISSVLGFTGALIRPPICDSLECKTSNFRSAILIGLGFGIDNLLIGMLNNNNSITRFVSHRISIRLEGTACLVLLSGIGQRAVKHAITGGLIWGALVFFMVTLVYISPSPTPIVLNAILYGILIAFFGMMWLLPNEGALFRRPAAIYYGRFWTLYRAALLVSVVVQEYSDIGFCLQSAALIVGVGIMKMFVVYRTFELEAIWWHGGFEIEASKSSDRQFSDSVSEISTNIDSPFQRLQLSGNAANAMILAQSTVVPMINFAALRIIPSRMLGAGSSARVYEGRLRKQKCAVKLLFTVELRPEEITRCSEEASLLLQIQKHSIHVVGLLGLAILPPSLCVVLELCSEGSLHDVLYKRRKHERRRSDNSDRSSIEQDEYAYRLSWAERLDLAVGASRGVTAVSIAGYSHNDIKQVPFLK